MNRVVGDIDQNSAPIWEQDLRWLGHVESSLEVGDMLKAWWREKSRWSEDVDCDQIKKIVGSDLHEQSFLLTRPSPRWPRDLSYGFYDRAVVNGLDVPVLGFFQQVYFDRPKAGRLGRVEARVEDEGTRRRWSENLRAFVLNHLLRQGSFEDPFTSHPDERRPLAAYLQPFSLTVSAHESKLKRGLTSSQLYYRRADDGRIGKFWPPDRYGIQLDGIERYRWIIAHFKPESSELRLRLNGEHVPHLALPLSHNFVCVLRAEDVIDTPGRYGLSYSLLGDQRMAGPMGFGKLLFLVQEDGQILFQACSVNFQETWLTARLPDPALWVLDLLERGTLGLLSPALEPLRESLNLLPGGHSLDLLLFLMDALDSATFGLTTRQLGLSRQQLEKRLLAADAIGLMRTANSVGPLWRLSVDWADSTSGEVLR